MSVGQQKEKEGCGSAQCQREAAGTMCSKSFSINKYSRVQTSPTLSEICTGPEFDQKYDLRRVSWCIFFNSQLPVTCAFNTQLSKKESLVDLFPKNCLKSFRSLFSIFQENLHSLWSLPFLGHKAVSFKPWAEVRQEQEHHDRLGEFDWREGDSKIDTLGIPTRTHHVPWFRSWSFHDSKCEIDTKRLSDENESKANFDGTGVQRQEKEGHEKSHNDFHMTFLIRLICFQPRANFNLRFAR